MNEHTYFNCIFQLMLQYMSVQHRWETVMFLKDVHFLVSLILLGCFVGDLPTLYTNNECEISICEANYCFSSLRAIKKLNILFDAIDNGLSR